MFIDIIMLVDTSFSIAPVIDSYTRGINNVIETQQKLNPNSHFTLYTFNQYLKTLCCNASITSLTPLNSRDLSPSGGTAMYTAIHTTLSSNKDNPNPVIFIIMTDGEDNFSHIKPFQVREIISILKNKSWFFIFLGASPRANAIGNSMGIEKCVLYNNTPSSIGKASDVVNIAISKASSIVTGRGDMLSEQNIPDDVRDLTNAISNMKLK